MGLFLEFLQDDGFIVLSLTRNSVEDPRFCMIHPGNLLETPVPMVGLFVLSLLPRVHYVYTKRCGALLNSCFTSRF